MTDRNKIFCGDAVEVLKTLLDGCVDMCITSPPYWGLRSYSWGGQVELCTGDDGNVHHEWSDKDSILQECAVCGTQRPRCGLEPTIDEYIENQVAVFREVRRVLKDWGTCWVNMGDSYNTSGGAGRNRYWDGRQDEFGAGNRPPNDPRAKHLSGLKPKDLCMVPARLAMALQKDGWYLRSDIIWAKGLSFCESYSGSVMPESVNGWRWERCRVKVKAEDRAMRTSAGALGGFCKHSGNNVIESAQWQACPGCDKCRDTDGYVLRKGSWRPTKAHEYLFMLAKSETYFCDQEAVRETASGVSGGACFGSQDEGAKEAGAQSRTYDRPEYSGRNLRDVWAINPKAYKYAHYATFPPELVEPCIKAGTSEKGNCAECGMPWVRIVDVDYEIRSEGPAGITIGGTSMTTSKGYKEGGIHSYPIAASRNTTLGWKPSCKCGADSVPAVVLDPYGGSGTTGAVAAKLGRDYILIELNPEYIEGQAQYRLAEAETGITVAEQRAGQMGLFGAEQ